MAENQHLTHYPERSGLPLKISMHWYGIFTAKFPAVYLAPGAD